MSRVVLVLFAIGIVLWPLESWFIVRFGRANRDARANLGWVPLLRTIVVARAAGAGWMSWLLSLVPFVGLYVNWDWWDDVFDGLGKRRAGLRAVGTLVPGLRAYLMFTAAKAAETRSRPVIARPAVA